MLNLKVISGLISAALGIIGMIALLFFSSPAVATVYMVLGYFSFGVLFMYGADKALGAYYDAVRDFQINN